MIYVFLTLKRHILMSDLILFTKCRFSFPTWQNDKTKINRIFRMKIEIESKLELTFLRFCHLIPFSVLLLLFSQLKTNVVFAESKSLQLMMMTTIEVQVRNCIFFGNNNNRQQPTSKTSLIGSCESSAKR